MNTLRLIGFMEMAIGIVLGTTANIQGSIAISIFGLCLVIIGACLLSTESAWEKK